MTEEIVQQDQDHNIPSGIKVHSEGTAELPKEVVEPQEEPKIEPSEPEKEEDDKEDQPHKPSGYKKTKAQRDALRSENEALKAEIEKYKTPSKPVVSDEEPDPDQYETMAQYTKAVARYEAKKLADEEKATKSQFERQHAVTQKVAEFKKVQPDYEEALKGYAEEYPITEQMVSAIEDSDKAPQVAYYITQNPEIGERMAEMSPMQLAREIGKIEARLEEPVEKRETKASPPITPVKAQGSAAGVQKPLHELSVSELQKRYPVKH